MSQPMSLPWSGLLAEMVAEQTGDDLDPSQWPGEGEGTGYVSPELREPVRTPQQVALDIARVALERMALAYPHGQKGAIAKDALERIVTILSEGRE